MALTAEDIGTIQQMIDATVVSARLPQRGPRAPDDLVYEGNGAYYSPGTKMGYAKGPGGQLIQTGIQS
jgi:hypothetical protein